MIWIALASLALLVAVAASRHRSRPTVVIGRQMAEARANERARLAAGPVRPSPMPGRSYEAERGDYSLISVRPVSLDNELQTIVHQFAAASPDGRRENRSAISMAEEYTLLHFASRCAVLAVRETSPTRCEDGLIGLAMIDETRIDPRDAFQPVVLLSYAIREIGADANALVERATRLATTSMARFIQGAKAPLPLSKCRYAEVRADDGGFGLIRSGQARYEPTLEITKLAIQVATWLQDGRYTAAPTVAEVVPPVWFAMEHRLAAEAMVKDARAVVAIHGTLRPSLTTHASMQPILAWVAEMETEEKAALLCSYVGDGMGLKGRFSAGVSSGRLFALFVAGSFAEGVAPFESRESVRALADEARQLLDVASAAA